jgi:hypothetical protein
VPREREIPPVLRGERRERPGARARRLQELKQQFINKLYHARGGVLVSDANGQYPGAFENSEFPVRQLYDALTLAGDEGNVIRCQKISPDGHRCRRRVHPHILGSAGSHVSDPLEHDGDSSFLEIWQEEQTEEEIDARFPRFR